MVLSLILGALLVNPWDIDALSQSFYKAVTMPSENITKTMRMLSKYVFTYTAQEWGSTFIKKMISGKVFCTSLEVCFESFI